jgi:hypothetical protein
MDHVPRTSSSRFSTALAAALLLAGCTGRPAGDDAISIASARRLGGGPTARVEGIVTVAAGTLDGGFALQDSSAGIYVAADSTLRPAVGVRVRVSGRLGDSHAMLTLLPDSARSVGRGGVPAADSVTTATVGAANEGRLVRVRGRARGPLESDLPWGYKLWVDDGSGAVQIFLPASGHFSAIAVRAGQSVTATGLSARYDSTREVVPRTPADLGLGP